MTTVEIITIYNDTVQAYLDDLRRNDASENTITNYAARLGHFADYMRETGVTEAPSFTVVQGWRDKLFAKGCAASTIKQYLKELRAFFDWASDPAVPAHVYESNPVSKRLIPTNKKEGRRPYDEILTDEAVIALWRNESRVSSRPEFWERNYAIVVLILTTGIRNAELLDLTPADIDWVNSEITVRHGKGDKFRIVDMPEIAVTALTMYLRSGIRPESSGQNSPIFGTMVDGVWGRGTRQWLSALIERHVKAVTGIGHVTSHDLRHVAARLDLNAGMSLEALQAKLGHESMNTTQVYSGKLAPRRRREQGERVMQAQTTEAKRNADILQAS